MAICAAVRRGWSSASAPALGGLLRRAIIKDYVAIKGVDAGGGRKLAREAMRSWVGAVVAAKAPSLVGNVAKKRSVLKTAHVLEGNGTAGMAG